MNSIGADSTRAPVERLANLRNVYAADASAEKLRLLDALADRAVRAGHAIRKLHATLCFLNAFPDNANVHRATRRLLDSFGDRIADLPKARRANLDDTGIAGTVVRYEFSYEIADRLASRYDDAVDIDWASYESPERLDEILVHVLAHAEGQTFDDGEVTTRAWIRRAKGRLRMTDLAWLLCQLRAAPSLRNLRASLYDAAEVPVKWDLGGSEAAVGCNRFDRGGVVFRRGGLRRFRGTAGTAIAGMLPGIERLPREQAHRMIEVATFALAARQREVYAIVHANPDEVYLAPLGAGTSVAVIGVKPKHRLSIEANYGYVLMSNGVPIGYGGVSPLFHQANTGINIFEEFRGSEASFLFVRMLRAFHTLFGSTRFIANPYQFGRGNAEAIRSGAFWFYYRLGFRPVDRESAGMAAREFEKIGKRRGYRTDATTLRTLARSDLHLTLPGARRAQLFQETWLAKCADGATDAIAGRMCNDRSRAIDGIVRDVAATLGVKNRRSWPVDQRLGFERLALLFGLIADLEEWSAADKRALVRLARTKGALREREYANLLRSHDRLRRGLERFCRNNR